MAWTVQSPSPLRTPQSTGSGQPGFRPWLSGVRNRAAGNDEEDEIEDDAVDDEEEGEEE